MTAHGRDVNAALVGERAAADVGRVRIGVLIGHRGDELRDLGEPAERLVGQDPAPQLELQGRDERHEIEVATALAVTPTRITLPTASGEMCWYESA